MSFRLAQTPSSKNNVYVCCETLKGHIGAVISLGVTDDGKLLASGGKLQNRKVNFQSTNLQYSGIDGTRVWDLANLRSLSSPSNPDIRGATTAIVWIKRANDPGEALFYGTQEGFLVCWRQGAVRLYYSTSSGFGADAQQGVADFEEVFCGRLDMPGEITGLAFDTVSNRLAVCNRNGLVHVYALDGSMNLRSLYLRSIPKSSPKSIAFGAISGNERDILVFSLYSGRMCVLR